MSEPTVIPETNSVDAIRERWATIPDDQCEDWWWSAIRHVQRNVDGMCPHESWGVDSESVPEAAHPGRHDGTIYAHAPADIHYLLGLVTPEPRSLHVRLGGV